MQGGVRVTKIAVHNRVSDFNSYRAARVKSLFNAENGCNFDLEVDADLSGDWNIGVVVGPSGSGKTSIGKIIFGEDKIYDYHDGWSPDKPIIDEIAPGGDFNMVTGALANVGLGDVPAWLRPFRVLSNGEQFRAGLARIVCEKPQEIVVDEFTSVIDRQIAKIGSQAFQKAWRRNNPTGKVVLLTPHYHDLWGRIFPVGVQMLCDAVDAIQAGAVESYPQEEACATWEPSFDRPRLKRNDLFRLGTVAGYTRVRCADCINYICDNDNYRCLCGLSVAAGKKLYVSDNDTCSRGERK